MESSVEVPKISGASNPKPALAPKPALVPKPFSLQRNTTIRSIHAPKTSPPKTQKSEGTSVSKSTLTTAAQKPSQPTATSNSDPGSQSVVTKSQPKPTKAGEAGPQKEETLSKDSSVLKSASQTSPPKETAKTEPVQKNDVVQTNHSASGEPELVAVNSVQKDGKKKEDETQASAVQMLEHSGSDGSSSTDETFHWGGARKRLSTKLTSKFESGGPILPPQPTTAISTANTKSDSNEPVLSAPEQKQAVPEPSNRESDESELKEDYSGRNSIKRRISQLFDSRSRPEVMSKREEPEILDGIGGVKERIKNWATETEKKPQAASPAHSKSFEPVTSPTAVKLPQTSILKPSAEELSPSPTVDPPSKVSPAEELTKFPMETLKGAHSEEKSLESAAKTPEEQNKSPLSDLQLSPNPSEDVPKKNNVKRRSVRFGTVQSDDGSPPLILGSDSDSDSEEEDEEEEGPGDTPEEDVPVTVPVYERVGILQKIYDESQRQEEERLKHLEFEERRQAEEKEEAKLMLEKEQKRDEEREKEKARQKEEHRLKEEERAKQKEEQIKQEKEEREKERLKEEERRKEERKRQIEKERIEMERKMQREKEEEMERLRLLEKQREEERKRQIEKERIEMERKMQREKEEEMERLRLLEKQREEERREEERKRQIEKERIEMERKMQREKEEEMERLRLLEKHREEEKRQEERKRQIEKERIEMERKTQQKKEEMERMIKSDSLLPNTYEPTESPIDIVYDDFSVKQPQLDIEFDDFSVKPVRMTSVPKIETSPVLRTSWVDFMDKEEVEELVSLDVKTEKIEEDEVEKPALEEREEVEETKDEPEVGQLLSVEADEEEKETDTELEYEVKQEAGQEDEVNNFSATNEDKDTDALIDFEPDQDDGVWKETPESSSPQPVPDQVPEVSSEDTADTQEEPELAPFPESSAPLLDTSAQRSKADLGKRLIRTRPSRVLRAGLVQKEPTVDLKAHDSHTDEKETPSKEKESDSEDEQPKPKVACSQAQRVPVFPGMSPGDLLAQLKRRTGGGGTGVKEETVENKAREEREHQDEEVALSPSELPRSPRMPAHLAGATRVLPPIGGKDQGGASSPAWLQELKSKKRMSQYGGDA